MLDVALAAGVSPETLRKIETGRIATPSFATIAALAGVVGLSLDALWAEVQPAPSGGGRSGLPVPRGRRRPGPPVARPSRRSAVRARPARRATDP